MNDYTHKKPENQVYTQSEWVAKMTHELQQYPHKWRYTPVNGNKAPYLSQWQKNPLSAQLMLAELQVSECHGIGLLCGTPSGGMLLIDHDGESCDEKILELSGCETLEEALPRTVGVTSYKPGRYQLVYRVPEPYWGAIATKKIKTGVTTWNEDKQKNEVEQVEFRWDGCQSVICGEHPETGAYGWLVEQAPWECEIASAPLWALEQMLIDTTSKKAPHSSNNSRYSTPKNFNQWTEIDYARSYLSALAPWRTDDYETWVKVGMALKTVDEELLADWDDWSRQSSKYKPGECEPKWKSFERSDITIATLGGWAKEDGWQSPESKKEYRSQEQKKASQMPIAQAVEKAREILLSGGSSELEENTLLEELRQLAGVNEWTWENKFIKPLKQELKATRLKLEVQTYLQESDPFEQVRLKSHICSVYQISSQDFKQLVQRIDQQQAVPQQTSFSFDEFFNQETEALRWIIPGILPTGEAVLLAAAPKVGKTLLATDAAYAVLAGSKVVGEQVGVKGKVLLISSDESPNSTRRRLYARGFDILEERNHLRVMTHLDISDLNPLEQQLEDFRPQLVVIDSLTSITQNLGVCEKDTEFARYVYKLKDLLGKYNASGILIHHENKDKEAKGINKVSGSSRIPAAVWGIWQMVAANPDDETNPTRWLKVKPRESEAVTLTLELNPQDLWASKGIFEFKGEFGDESGQKKSNGDRILDLLAKYSPRGLETQEIEQYLGLGKSVYKALSRLEDRQLVTKRRSEVNKRSWVYALPE